jgi:hypothetical protein
MQLFPRISHFLPCLFLLGICAEALALPVARMRGVQPVLEVKGERQTWKLASERGALVFGDTVRAGARGKADLLFNNGTRISLRAGSQLQILAPASAGKPLVVRVFGAFSEVFVRAKGPTEIRTAAGTAAVRGTEYLVRVDAENRTTVTVAEGAVAFFNPQGEVLLAANQTSTAVVGSAPTPPTTVDVSGLLAWTFESAGLPLEIENRFLPTKNEGERLFNAGRAAQAAQFFAAQVQTTPNADNLLSLGRASLGSGDLIGAQSAFERALALDATNAEAKIGLALTALSRGELDTGCAAKRATRRSTRARFGALARRAFPRAVFQRRYVESARRIATRCAARPVFAARAFVLRAQ